MPAAVLVLAPALGLWLARLGRAWLAGSRLEKISAAESPSARTEASPAARDSPPLEQPGAIAWAGPSAWAGVGRADERFAQVGLASGWFAMAASFPASGSEPQAACPLSARTRPAAQSGPMCRRPGTAQRPFARLGPGYAGARPRFGQRCWVPGRRPEPALGQAAQPAPREPHRPSAAQPVEPLERAAHQARFPADCQCRSLLLPSRSPGLGLPVLPVPALRLPVAFPVREAGPGAAAVGEGPSRGRHTPESQAQERLLAAAAELPVRERHSGFRRWEPRAEFAAGRFAAGERSPDRQQPPEEATARGAARIFPPGGVDDFPPAWACQQEGWACDQIQGL